MKTVTGCSSRFFTQVINNLRLWLVELLWMALAALLLGLLLKSICGDGLLMNGDIVGSSVISTRLLATEAPAYFTLISSRL